MCSSKVGSIVPPFATISCCLAQCNGNRSQTTATTVIARSEATWQSPGTCFQSQKHQNLWKIPMYLVPFIESTTIMYIAPGDCHGPKGPHNDTVVVGRVHRRYRCKQQFIFSNQLSYIIPHIPGCRQQFLSKNNKKSAPR